MQSESMKYTYVVTDYTYKVVTIKGTSTKGKYAARIEVGSRKLCVSHSLLFQFGIAVVFVGRGVQLKQHFN